MDGSVEAAQPLLHYGAHWIGPFLIAALVWREHWIRAGLVIASANLIDLDHLLADPIFDPNRCSVGFHLLHGWEAALIYAALLLVPRWWAKALGTGALWHLIVDAGDCMAMTAIQP